MYEWIFFDELVDFAIQLPEHLNASKPNHGNNHKSSHLMTEQETLQHLAQQAAKLHTSVCQKMGLSVKQQSQPQVGTSTNDEKTNWTFGDVTGYTPPPLSTLEAKLETLSGMLRQDSKRKNEAKIKALASFTSGGTTNSRKYPTLLKMKHHT